MSGFACPFPVSVSYIYGTSSLKSIASVALENAGCGENACWSHLTSLTSSFPSKKALQFSSVVVAMFSIASCVKKA